ncbi:MAG: transposase [Candidatus Eisenbacteria bacterium]|uniref:Transposase n=1 Tax=Eiseniibacteriota bacterium TaxID=2212470 RepID=A0A948W7S1_UNCEI|nr:transposase [Candidatus Eisenbacteria bacterium]MBU1947609.1 transposase [Candidatus Eisenbacteria bacterium]MBU2691946.1 transposase [Candidatus Eisenbacteria bacterium]
MLEKQIFGALCRSWEHWRRGDPSWKVHCARGDVENRIKELKVDLQNDRTSCTIFLANQLRVLMTAAAYVLLQELCCH